MSLQSPCRCRPQLYLPALPRDSVQKVSTSCYLPTAYHEQLRTMIPDDTSPAPYTNQTISGANSVPEVYRTSPETRQFLGDIALLFSRDRTGSRLGSTGEKRSEGPSYVAATMLSRRRLNDERVQLTIHVALNTTFSQQDRNFGDKLVEFLNKSPSDQENAERNDVQDLAFVAARHCRGRLKSYFQEARPYFAAEIKNGSQKYPTSLSSWVDLQKEVEMHIEPEDICHRQQTLKKFCKILRACRRIVQFRDNRSGDFVGEFAIKEADAKQVEARKFVHCEMKLVHEYICGNIGPVFDYIGCTKLPCLRCWYTINVGSRFTTGDETHWKIYNWSCWTSGPAIPALSRLEETNVELEDWLNEGSKKKATSTAVQGELYTESPVNWEVPNLSGGERFTLCFDGERAVLQGVIQCLGLYNLERGTWIG